LKVIGCPNFRFHSIRSVSQASVKTVREQFLPLSTVGNAAVQRERWLCAETKRFPLSFRMGDNAGSILKSPVTCFDAENQRVDEGTQLDGLASGGFRLG
jgi:hypothetical protein